MDILVLMIVLHVAMYSPYFFENVSRETMEEVYPDNTVATTGIPFYYMGDFVGYVKR